MMWIHLVLGESGPCCPDFFYKNGAIWCILSVPKYVIINQKINNFRIINQQQPKLCAMLFSKTNPGAHISTKINTLTFLQEVGSGSPQKPKKF